MKKCLIKKLTSIVCMAAFACSLTACGSAATSDVAKSAEANYVDMYDVYEEAAAAYDMSDSYASNEADYAAGEEMAMYAESEAPASAANDSSMTTENATTSNRKLIRTVNLSVETKEFDSLVSNITSEISSLGGYIENMNGSYGSIYATYRSNKSAYIVARVPAAKLDGFINTVGSSANITARSESVEDVTLNYVDMESHKRMLIEEQDRLLEFLEQADTVEDIISLEDRLTSVKYQIDSMESQLRTYDNKVDYSTVEINISEVVDYTTPIETKPELTPFERMTEGFITSLASIGVGLREAGIWFVIKLPYIVLLAIIALIALAIIKLILKKNAAKIEVKKEEVAKAKEKYAFAKSKNASADDNSNASAFVERPNNKKED